MTTFSQLDLIEPLQRALARVGYTTPTPIQAQAIPPLLEGRDVLGCAQTGTGKTAAFALPVLQHMAERPAPRGKPRIRALVLTPTRELAAQIDESFRNYGADLGSRNLVIFGGVSENPQIKALRRGVEVLVATPGRLLDLEGRGHIDLSKVEFFVLDEADRMLDMGFIHDVRRVLDRLPGKQQNLLFSATMPPKIVQLAGSFLRDPIQVEVTPESTTVEQIEQSVYFTEKADKRRLLEDLIHGKKIQRAIVFTRTKHGANRLTKQLAKAEINAAPIHGNKSQGARERALEGFRQGTVRILVATDIAARGIDVDGVTHVFNFDLPNEPESYVHRIGRTGRAGKDGVAIAFCDPSEGEYLRDIEKLIGFTVPVVEDHAYHCRAAVPPPATGSGRRQRERGEGGSAGGRRAAQRGRGGGRSSGRGRGRRDRHGDDTRERTEGGPRRRRRRSNGGRVRPEAATASSGRGSRSESTPSFGGRRGGSGRRG